MLGPALSQLLAELDAKPGLHGSDQRLHDELSRAYRMSPEFERVLELHLDGKLGAIELQISRADAREAIIEWRRAVRHKPERSVHRRRRAGVRIPGEHSNIRPGAETAIEGGGWYPDHDVDAIEAGGSYPGHDADAIEGGGVYPDPKPDREAE